MSLLRRLTLLLSAPVRLFLLVGRRFRRDSGFDLASSLSYTSLLSLVPLLAIGAAILAAFPALADMRERILTEMLSLLLPEAPDQAERYLTRYVANAGKLTSVGLAGLLVSAAVLIAAIETALNKVFRADAVRPPAARILIYWSLLTLGPLVLGASLSVSAWSVLGDLSSRFGLMRLTGFATMGLEIFLFALLFWILPTRRPRFADALIGAAVALIGFTVLRKIIGLPLGQIATYRSLYGAVAIVPILLFSLYVFWVMLLLGAEVTAVLPHWRQGESSSDAPDLTPRQTLAAALTILQTLEQSMRNSGKGLDDASLSRRTGLPQAVCDTLCAVLERAELITLSAESRYLPGRTPDSMMVRDLAGFLGLSWEGAPLSDWPQLNRSLRELIRAEEAILSLSLRKAMDPG